MEKLILFDLDNTLLGNDMDTFLPAYFKSLQDAFPGLEPDRLYSAMAVGTQAALTNQSPDKLLETTFDEVFYPTLGIRKVDYHKPIERYYREGFPAIKAKTRRIPEAVQVVADAREAGFRVAVATNPLFSAAAIHQRLHWAGFSRPEQSFELVTTIEDMHFTKPNPAYYAEILARLGWHEGPVLMVGDDEINDIQGAQGLGLPTYRIADSPKGGAGFHPRHGAGPLGAVLDWLAGTSAEDLLPEFSTPAAVLAIIQSTLAVLHYWLEKAGAQWDWRAEDGGWSIQEIVCHLRDVEREGFAARLDLFAQQPEPFLPGLDTETWYESRDYSRASGQAAFNEFLSFRKQTIQRLNALQPQDWEKPARHAIFGPTNFLESMRIMAGHDRIHVRQIAEIMRSATVERIE